MGTVRRRNIDLSAWLPSVINHVLAGMKGGPVIIFRVPWYIRAKVRIRPSPKSHTHCHKDNWNYVMVLGRSAHAARITPIANMTHIICTNSQITLHNTTWLVVATWVLFVRQARCCCNVRWHMADSLTHWLVGTWTLLQDHWHVASSGTLGKVNRH